MKSLLFATVCAAFTFSLTAQTEGVIIFEEKIDLHRRLPEDRPELKEMMPNFRSSFFELHYTEDASKYIARAADDEEVVSSHGQARIHMRMSPPKREVYKSLASDQMVDEREFMTKMFLIKGNTSPYKWKIADGQKQILDYLCMKATYQDSVSQYTAWFTPQIQVSNGPAEFGGLPGMVLQVEINDGERIITATQVTGQDVDKELLKEPTKGKEVTQEEFRAIMREKMAEMKEMQGGGPGPVMIIRQ